MKIKKAELKAEAERRHHKQKTTYLNTIDYLGKKILVIILSTMMMLAICCGICFFTGCARRMLYNCRKKNHTLGLVRDQPCAPEGLTDRNRYVVHSYASEKTQMKPISSHQSRKSGPYNPEILNDFVENHLRDDNPSSTAPGRDNEDYSDDQ